MGRASGGRGNDENRRGNSGRWDMVEEGEGEEDVLGAAMAVGGEEEEEIDFLGGGGGDNEEGSREGGGNNEEEDEEEGSDNGGGVTNPGDEAQAGGGNTTGVATATHANNNGGGEDSGIVQGLTQHGGVSRADAHVQRELSWQRDVKGDTTKVTAFKMQVVGLQNFRAFLYMKPKSPLVQMAHSIGQYYGFSGLAPELQDRHIAFIGDRTADGGGAYAGITPGQEGVGLDEGDGVHGRDGIHGSLRGGGIREQAVDGAKWRAIGGVSATDVGSTEFSDPGDSEAGSMPPTPGVEGGS